MQAFNVPFAFSSSMMLLAFNVSRFCLLLALGLVSFFGSPCEYSRGSALGLLRHLMCLLVFLLQMMLLPPFGLLLFMRFTCFLYSNSLGWVIWGSDIFVLFSNASPLIYLELFETVNPVV